MSCRRRGDAGACVTGPHCQRVISPSRGRLVTPLEASGTYWAALRRWSRLAGGMWSGGISHPVD
jgi:hypothetical protein